MAHPDITHTFVSRCHQPVVSLKPKVLKAKAKPSVEGQEADDTGEVWCSWCVHTCVSTVLTLERSGVGGMGVKDQCDVRMACA
jgi:hypothetical protein